MKGRTPLYKEMRFIPWYTLLLALIILSFPIIGSGAENDPPELIGDRPDFTESATVVPSGSIQAETGYTFRSNEDSYEHSVGELLIRIGFYDRIELRVGINSLIVRDRYNNTKAGKDELSLGMKLQILSPPGTASWQPAIALIASSALPIGSPDFIEHTFQPGTTLAANWTISESISCGINVGYTYASEEENYYHELISSISLGFSLTDSFGTYLEYYLIYPDGDNGVDAHFMDIGFTYLATENVQFDARGGMRIDSPVEEYFIGIGAILIWND